MKITNQAVILAALKAYCRELFEEIGTRKVPAARTLGLAQRSLYMTSTGHVVGTEIMKSALREIAEWASSPRPDDADPDQLAFGSMATDSPRDKYLLDIANEALGFVRAAGT